MSDHRDDSLQSPTTPREDGEVEFPHPPFAPGPNMPEQLPQYNLGRRTAEMREAYFDTQGRPRIASAREVAPPAENPFAWWQRLGEWTAWTTGRGAKFWPGNVRLNIIVFYLLGKRAGNAREALLCSLPWLLLLGMDASFLLAYHVRFGVGQLLLGVFTTMVLSFFLAGTWAVLMTQMHFNRVRTLVPFDELSLSRVEPPELLYGLCIRPWSSLQAFNLFHALAMMVAMTVVVAMTTRYVISMGTMPWADLFFAPVLYLLVPLRWWIMTQGINHGVAYAMRARLFLRHGGRAFREGMTHFLAQGLGFPILVPLLFGLLIYYARTLGFCIFALIAFLLLWIFQLVFREIQHRTWRILKSTLKYHRDWAVYNDTTGETIPPLAKDVY